MNFNYRHYVNVPVQHLSESIFLSLRFTVRRGEVVNGGFGLLLDGSDEAAGRADLMLAWDVSNGVARR